MSSFSEDKKDGPRAPDGEELSPFELDLLKKITLNPRLWEDKAKVWIADYVSQNSLLPIGQVQGFTQFVANAAPTIVTLEGRANVAYGDLATVGPTLSNLAAGTYLVFFGCQMIPSGGETGIASVSLNAAAASDDNGINVSGGNISTSRAISVTFTTTANTLQMKYRTGGGANVDFAKRWMIALKVGN